MDVYVFINGERKSLRQLSIESGVAYETILARWRNGVPADQLAQKTGGSGEPGPPGEPGYTPQRGVDYFTPADIQDIVNTVLEQVKENDKKKYPVGRLWISESPTNPADILGFGTWEQIQDRFLLSAGSTYPAGATGGAATHKHTYGLKVYEYYNMAAFNPKGGLTGAINIDDGTLGTWTGGSSMAGTETLNSSLGTTSASANPYHYESRANTSTVNNMPPYLAVYVWKRTA